MSVNGVTSTQSAAYAYAANKTAADNKKADTAAKIETSAKSETAKAEETGVIYEPSQNTDKVTEKKTYKPDMNLINKLKADSEARVAQMKSLVEQLISKQANTYGQANDIWNFLREGNFTVDPATKAQAEADIAEDGYWGVNQTSDRIIEFATALTGGDPSKIEEMRSAFEKGFKQAEKTWGGELPEISQKTYEAVMKKFDQLAEEAGIQTES